MSRRLAITGNKSMFGVFMSMLASVGGSFTPVADGGTLRRRTSEKPSSLSTGRSFYFAHVKGAKSRSQHSRSNRRKAARR